MLMFAYEGESLASLRKLMTAKMLMKGRGGGGNNWQNLAYVVYGCPLVQHKVAHSVTENDQRFLKTNVESEAEWMRSYKHRDRSFGQHSNFHMSFSAVVSCSF